MKNKGYTLLELLGVIVILSVLVTLVFPSVINFIKKGNEEKENIINELIIGAASEYINDNSYNLYLTSGVEYCVSVNTLIRRSYLNNIIDDDNLYSTKSVKVSYDNKVNYEIVDSNDCSVCKLVSGNYNEIGSKYQCKVKDDMEIGFEEGYYFHLLSTNEAGTINLIMDRNICFDGTLTNANKTDKCLVAWYSLSSDHSYGPVTALTHLHNATKDWNNIPNMIMNYDDENIETSTQEKGTDGYGSIKTNGIETTILSKNNMETLKIENLKARIPTYNEVTGKDKCTVSPKSCPLWLINYLKKSSYVNDDKVQNISEIQGYWTLSSYAGDATYAWYVNYSTHVNNGVVKSSTFLGVRPVITVNNTFVLD